ncbi:MAG TPA: CUAEP/CCAEP-tail radical SAM protein [Anaerolineae bacterium]|nr:CUAEP/CCAEP-tail radical SAM protein [Anaerolineae bacterium]
MNILLIATYDLGHQPFGLASPAAWLRQAGATVTTLDLSRTKLDTAAVRTAQLIALYLPMHTATRLATNLIPRLRRLNPNAHLAAYGLYALPNADLLRTLGLTTLISGEFETGLVNLYHHLQDPTTTPPPATHSLGRQNFILPDRTSLPTLDQYTTLSLPSGETRITGYTQASRGCKHLCGHCPIVPVYNGRFRIIPRPIVLADIAQQVAAGAQHITFGDPDFLNGPGHALPLVHEIHQQFPNLTYDVTIKVEHLRQHAASLATLRDTGCLFITSAVEAMDNDILTILDKGHTRDEFIAAATHLRQLGLHLNPTFVTFTPWTTPQHYHNFLTTIADLDLIPHVTPIQYAIRLLIPAGSKLLERQDIQDLVDPFDPQALVYPWAHPNPAMDTLYEHIFHLVKRAEKEPTTRSQFFQSVWTATQKILDHQTAHYHQHLGHDTQNHTVTPVPQLSESWY